MKKRMFIFFLMIVLLVTLSGMCSARVERFNVPIDDIAIDNIHAGITIEEMIEIYGNPSDQKKGDMFSYYIWEDLGIRAMTRGYNTRAC